MTPSAVELTSEAEKPVPLCNADQVRVDQALRVELPPRSAVAVFRFNDHFSFSTTNARMARTHLPRAR